MILGNSSGVLYKPHKNILYTLEHELERVTLNPVTAGRDAVLLDLTSNVSLNSLLLGDFEETTLSSAST